MHGRHSFLHDAIKYREEGMKDLVLTAPSEGTGMKLVLFHIKGGPDQENAKKFIDWCLTKKAQESVNHRFLPILDQSGSYSSETSC